MTVVVEENAAGAGRDLAVAPVPEVDGLATETLKILRYRMLRTSRRGCAEASPPARPDV
jgi:hypothetical protein